MIELISAWLAEQGLNSKYLASSAILIGVGLILLIASLSYYFAKNPLLSLVNKIVIHSKNTWDDSLISHGVMRRMTLLIPLFVILILTPHILEANSIASNLLILFSKILLAFQIAYCINALLNSGRSIYQESAKQQVLPIDAIVQIIKLAVYLVATIIIISLLVDRSPIYLLSGLGALTAGLLLVFQDTIKGLVASIQISAYKMVVVGDWVELPNYGANGNVLEIGLSTVKVENFDNTITTVPTYDLISGSFKNWRNMYQTGARRIKRTIIIDIASIDLFSTEKITQLTHAYLLTAYLSEKKQDIAPSVNDSDNAVEDKSFDSLNNRQLTNVGTFRAYILKYLEKNALIRDDFLCMVRQLPATPSGLPLEVYCFADTTDWAEYEGIQADIFDHLFAIAPQFDLRVYQQPTGYDWQKK